jgi:hypothetical protein
MNETLTATPRLSDAPPQIAALPRDAEGRPVPWGMKWVGEPEARRPDWTQTDPVRLARALAGRRCWTCGERLMLRSYSFVLTMHEALLRMTGAPPSHASCASYVARHSLVPGAFAIHDPDIVLAVWQCREYRALSNRHEKIMMLEPGAGNDVYWIQDGTAASRADVLAAFHAADAECYPEGGLLEHKAVYEERRRVLKRWFPE